MATQPQPGLQSTLTQQELESRLWAAANSLRGPVDPADFKAFIFPLLFFKRISDTWDAEHERALADFGDEELARLPENYRFQIPDGCHWRDLRRVTENVGVALQTMLQRVEQANPDSLALIFGDVAWANKDKLPEHALLNLLESFGSLDVRPDREGHDCLTSLTVLSLAYACSRRVTTGSHRRRQFVTIAETARGVLQQVAEAQGHRRAGGGRGEDQTRGIRVS